MNSATIVLNVEEIAQLALAAASFANLMAKVQTQAPDAWAAIQADFLTTYNTWKDSNNAAVTSIVNAPGVTDATPPESTDAIPAALPAVTVTGPVTLTPSATPDYIGASYNDASALPVGEHVQAPPSEVVEKPAPEIVTDPASVA